MGLQTYLDTIIYCDYDSDMFHKGIVLKTKISKARGLAGGWNIYIFPPKIDNAGWVGYLTGLEIVP